ncbi:FtsK/SpoIIIE domain-containing protein [Actinoplanes sp. L3-i22]|uniref:FtsK/SpoIIIE domain-containing protein n=1 Tax=Actinoplanes sp. L3-i22 TaxID=2836373 RepID=UPI001C86699A|nr:FtsK/SpoIIIE domain-containing protein [Actinoplanes sp. L3-i22]
MAGHRVPASDRLRIPLGLSPDATPIHLDLKEAVDSGMGPHGLIAGTAAPAVLRTITSGLAATHLPDEASFVLLDATPGSLVTLGRFPHTEVLVDATRMDLLPRLIEVLEGELARRKRLLVAAGCASHSEYLRGAATRPPMPALILICHEFSALFDAHPELLDLVRRIGWLGRARGIHLILAAADVPEPGVHGLAGYLSYRIALPGAPAFVLGPHPTGTPPAGHGLLRAHTEEPIPFALNPTAETNGTSPGTTAERFATSAEATAERIGTSIGATAERNPTGAEDRDAVERLSTTPPPTHRIWLPPLDEPPTLDDLAGPIVTDPDHLPRFADQTLHDTLQIPIAVLDKPRDHRRDTIWLPVAGNVAVVGGPGSGKTDLLRTATAALALAHTAPDLRVIAPASIAPDHQRIPLVHGVLDPSRPADDERRDLHALLDTPTGDTILMIDGWAEFWTTHPDWHDLLLEIARRGSSRGVHLIATATHWSDFDPRFTDHFGSRLELRLTDPAESTIDPVAAATVPADRPGRGIVAAPTGALHFLTARAPDDALVRSLSTDHCAECGFTYVAVSPADLPARFRATGNLYAAALLAATDLRRRPYPEVWSPLEYTCHLRDMLRVQRERLALALATDNPAFTPMGRAERPLRDGYNAQDPHTVLTELDQAGESLAAAFEALTPGDLRRTGTYNWPVTAVRDLLWIGRHTVHEIVHHLLDITRQR